jgi:hypothetical protein
MRHKITFLLVLLLLCAPLVHAWNPAGHIVTGIIAYKELKASHPQSLPLYPLLCSSRESCFAPATSFGESVVVSKGGSDQAGCHGDSAPDAGFNGATLIQAWKRFCWLGQSRS